MKFELIEDWRAVLKKAWSFKFCGLAFALTVTEVYVSLMRPDWIEPLVFSGLSAVCMLAAMFARVVAQKELSDAPAK